MKRETKFIEDDGCIDPDSMCVAMNTCKVASLILQEIVQSHRSSNYNYAVLRDLLKNNTCKHPLIVEAVQQAKENGFQIRF